MTIRPWTHLARAAALALFAVACAAPSRAQNTELLTPATRHAIADSVARILEARYADSTAAVRLAERLRARMARRLDLHPPNLRRPPPSVQHPVTNATFAWTKTRGV